MQRNNVNRKVAPPINNVRSSLERWAAIPLRLIVGYGFMAHGYAKIVRGPVYFAGTLHALGVPWPEFMGWTTIFVELIGGLAVLIGALIPLVSVPLAAILLIAAVTVHLPYGFSSIKLQSVTSDGPQFGKPGYETSLLYLAGLATLVLGGPGPFAVGGLVARARRNGGVCADSGRELSKRWDETSHVRYAAIGRTLRSASAPSCRKKTCTCMSAMKCSRRRPRRYLKNSSGSM